MRFGAHVSTAGGMPNAIGRALELECDAIQVFTRNQRTWSPPPLDPAAIEAFVEGSKREGFADTAVSHASYLINLCATDPDTLEKSRRAFVDEIERCAALSIPYVCLHPGSHVGEGEEAGLATIAENLEWALAETKGKRVHILLENTAGQGTNLGWDLAHLGTLIRAVGSKRIGVLIDTCHLFAAGYDFRTEKGLAETVAAMDDTFGLDRLRAFHLNDSVHDCGSKKDRHANIGEGAIGEEAFRLWVNEPSFEGLPAVLETPNAPEGYIKDLGRLRSYRN